MDRVKPIPQVPYRCPKCGGVEMRYPGTRPKRCYSRTCRGRRGWLGRVAAVSDEADVVSQARPDGSNR